MGEHGAFAVRGDQDQVGAGTFFRRIGTIKTWAGNYKAGNYQGSHWSGPGFAAMVAKNPSTSSWIRPRTLTGKMLKVT